MNLEGITMLSLFSGIFLWMTTLMLISNNVKTSHQMLGTLNIEIKSKVGENQSKCQSRVKNQQTQPIWDDECGVQSQDMLVESV